MPSKEVGVQMERDNKATTDAAVRPQGSMMLPSGLSSKSKRAKYKDLEVVETSLGRGLKPCQGEESEGPKDSNLGQLGETYNTAILVFKFLKDSKEDQGHMWSQRPQ